MTAALVRIHAIEPRSRANGPGARFVVWLQGCTLGCPGCFNPTTHDAAGGRAVAIDELVDQLTRTSRGGGPVGSIDGRGPPTGSAAEWQRGSIDGRGPPTGSAAEWQRGSIDGRGPPTGSAAEWQRGSIDGRGPPTGSAAEWQRGSIDGRGPPTGSAAEWRRGSIDGRGPPTGSAAEWQRGSIEGLSLSGGEPLQQPEAACALLDAARALGLSTLAFSGYSIDEIRALPGGPAVLDRLDVLIDGRYVAGERLATGLRGSANQGIQLLTGRYSRADVEATPVAEIRIGPTGDVILTGVDPLKLKQRP